MLDDVLMNADGLPVTSNLEPSSLPLNYSVATKSAKLLHIEPEKQMWLTSNVSIKDL